MEMFLDLAETQILSHAGWGEEYRWLWRYDIATGQEEKIEHFSNGFAFREGSDHRHLLLIDRPQPNTHRCTVRLAAEPLHALATAVHEPGRWTFEGDADLWELVPRFTNVLAEGRTQLLHIHPEHPELDPLDWYYHGSYDLAYQGLLEPCEIPGSRVLIMPVQRDSHPVLYDPTVRAVLGHLTLAERGGNPRLVFRRRADEVWADDYDTLLRLRPASWEVLNAVRLQGHDPVQQQFIGRFWLPLDERLCAVARPFSGDVLLVDPSTFAVVVKVRTGKQPLEAVVLGDGTVIARDWQSRQLIQVGRR
jgi:hypothetical protein